MGILEEALAKLLGLSHLYHKQLLTVKNQKVRETLEKLVQEKARHAKILQMAISSQGGDAKGVRVPLDRLVKAPRELIPRLYQEEQALSLWYREQISATRDDQIKALLQTLLKDEDQHLQDLKDLYRDLTHC